MRKILLLLLITLSSGCSTWQGITSREAVKPWERDILAQDGMQIPPDKMHAYSDDHIYFSKEASSGGNGVGGGGCGCN
jgi:hypothetical protein